MLRNNVSMVLQDSVLFEGSIKENIEIGRPGSTLEEVIEAARKADIHDLIASLPDGYDTIVREQGNNFSAGQRQRLTIARAILRDAPILILDEPTANLDVESEAEVMHALTNLMVGRTVLTISHRLSTLGHVDEILVIQGGRIIEQGTFKELKRKQGFFASLLDEQNRYSLDRGEDEGVFRSSFMNTVPEMPAIRFMKRPNTPALSSDTSPHLPAVVYSGGEATTGAYQLSPVLLGASGGNNGSEERSNGMERSAVRQSNLPRRGLDMPLPARVLVEVDGEPVGAYRLDKPILMVGRYPTSDIQISSPRVSRFHALIRWKQGAWVMEDAESLNGLSCQGQRIDELALVNADRVYIDPSIVLQYEEFPE
jgi:energy-coupling factor transporter ATP-binding protein EcfA2